MKDAYAVARLSATLTASHDDVRQGSRPLAFRANTDDESHGYTLSLNRRVDDEVPCRTSPRLGGVVRGTL